MPTKPTRPGSDTQPRPKNAACPLGGCVLKDEPIELNVGRPRTTLKARNTGDRPIQVGSHFHFFEVNRYLAFDRRAAFGQRLDIPANTAVRFEPGDEKEITLVPLGGKRFAKGFNNLVDGWAGDGPHPDYRPNLEAAMERATKRDFKTGLPPAPSVAQRPPSK